MNIWKLILVLIIVLPSIAFAQQNHRLFDIKNYDDTSFVLIGNEYGTNVGAFVSEEGLLLVDPMPGEQSLNELFLLIKGLSNKPVSYIANTHNHEDHTGGNEYFSAKGATILTQSNLSNEPGSDSKTQFLSKNFGLQVINVQSHTYQDYLYYHPKSNVLFVGDVFDNNWHPTFYAGGVEGFTKAIDKILAIGDKSTLIIPGHGAPANKGEVEAFYENTIVWLKRVSDLHKENISLEQMMKDEQINEILERFNTEGRKAFIPERAFRRFIERSISIVSSS